MSRREITRADERAVAPGGPREDEPRVEEITGIRFIDAAFDKAVQIPSAVVHAHVERLRRRNPHASPAQIVQILEKQYLLAVSASGGAVGAAAATPAIGTGVGVALTTSEVATFFAASSAFALAVADVHGIGIEETARRRTLLLATVLGDQGAKTVGAETGLGTKAWARTLLVNMPTSTIKRVNTALTRRLVRRQAAKQGALAFGRLAPFGIGAVIGATGARALGKTVVDGARRAFGPPPPHFTQTIALAVTRADDAAPVRQVTPRADAAAPPSPPSAPSDWPTPG
ncbi:hypothetical protein GXB85_06205 [Cellulomonas sp. APG4]|uniref:hypothetical protein n=1 Tax=Cellulomonas sp. APG4 TaxID=1538656 RepID=UPI00137A160D|nr:hypothetical protein [Cellulomonas sp. APG4]NCT90537.1 hypothetical protein [Cellulomonas sp. APG4]